MSVPNRGRLTAVRADEPGLIASVQQTARNYGNQPYPLTGMLFHVSAATTGGQSPCYQPGAAGAPTTLDANSQFAAGRQPAAPPSVGNMAPGLAPLPTPAQPKGLNEWYGLSESTSDEPEPPPARRRR